MRPVLVVLSPPSLQLLLGVGRSQLITRSRYSLIMSETSESRHILPPEEFFGKLVIDGQRIPVSLTASAGPSGRLEMEVNPIFLSDLPAGVLANLRSAGRPGQPINEFGLDCETCDGKRLKSDQVSLAQWRQGSESLQVKLRIGETSLAMAAKETHDRPALRFHLLGFSCFPSVRVDTLVGPVLISGATRTTASDQISGWITAEVRADSCSRSWRQSAEEMLSYLQSVLAFARGAPLATPVTEFYEGDTVEVTFQDTVGTHASYMPPISRLNLKPIVAAAAKNVTLVEDCREAFDIAIGWFLVPTSVDEVRFLSGMTALDGLASRTLDKSQMYILGNSASRRLARRVRAFVDEQENSDDSAKWAIKQKIPELNRRPFMQQITALLEKWCVSRISIKDECLARVVRLRNELVHQGGVPENEELWPSILVVREILVRLILSMLQFKGDYQCYLGGRHMRHFPDCNPVQ